MSRLCMQSPRGAVTWLLGNHELWPLLQSCRTCSQYAPFHQCASDGSYSREFRRTLIDALIAARAQAVVVANGVLCCHGGLNARFVQEAIRRTSEEPADSAAARKLLLQTINREFDSILAQAAASPDARLPIGSELGRFSWCLRPDSPLWCRPQADPAAFDALFRKSTYPQAWACLARGVGSVRQLPRRAQADRPRGGAAAPARGAAVRRHRHVPRLRAGGPDHPGRPGDPRRKAARYGKPGLIVAVPELPPCLAEWSKRSTFKGEIGGSKPSAWTFCFFCVYWNTQKESTQKGTQRRSKVWRLDESISVPPQPASLGQTCCRTYDARCEPRPCGV